MADDRSLRIPVRLGSWEELNRRVALFCAEVLGRISGWLTNAAGDWTPASDDQWIGDSHSMPRGVAVGNPTGDPAVPGVQGVVIERTGAQDPTGGVAVVGFRDQEVRSAVADPGLLANSPVEIAGEPVLLSGNVYIETTTPHTDERYLLVGEAVTVPDGRHFAPLLIGPQYIPSFSENATDTRAIDLDDIGGLFDVVTLNVTTGPYTPGVATFRYDVRLREQGTQGRDTDFDVEIWANIGGGGLTFVFRDEYSLAGAAQNVSVTVPVTTAAIGPGDQIVMRVSSTGTHPQSDGWVRGDERTSELELRQ